VVRDGKVLARAHRGELAEGDHAEYTALERKLPGEKLSGCTLITTLEPCTNRNHPKSPCAVRTAKRRIAKVYIGVLYPNPDVYGKGVLHLREHGVEIEMFPSDLAEQVRQDNKPFIDLHVKPRSIDPKKRKLDEWYYTINSIYFNRNFYRDTTSIFAHLVEIMGGLSVLATEKTKPEVNAEHHMAKAVAWWLALCAKVGLRSVEDLLWYKFPTVCPYCKRQPHDDDICREVKAKTRNPDWRALYLKGLDAIAQRPASLGGWQRMFGQIYAPAQTEKYDLIFGRFTEELGELSEAIRVGPVVPGYYLSEAADVFAWLMKLINVYESKHGIEVRARGSNLEDLMYKQYPDKCRVCGNAICECPPILASTLGRIAHDGPDPGLLVQARPFMSPTEAAAFFEIGSVQIVVGTERLHVTPELVDEVKYIVECGSPKFSQDTKIHPDALHHIQAVLSQMAALAQSGRVSDRHIQNLLRMMTLMSPRERGDCLAVFGSMSQNPLVKALVEWMNKCPQQGWQEGQPGLF